MQVQETKIMASGPIISWQIDGETMETVTDFIFWGSKITADGNCSHEIKRRLLLGRKAMTNLDSILKSRHYFADKGPSSQSYGFSSSHDISIIFMIFLTIPVVIDISPGNHPVQHFS